MNFHKINRSYRRCRLIAHTADLSALREWSAIRFILFISIISPYCIAGLFVHLHYTWPTDTKNLLSRLLLPLSHRFSPSQPPRREPCYTPLTSRCPHEAWK